MAAGTPASTVPMPSKGSKVWQWPHQNAVGDWTPEPPHLRHLGEGTLKVLCIYTISSMAQLYEAQVLGM